MTPFDPYAYLDVAAAALEMSVPPEQREGVAANLARLHALARYVAEFDPAAEPTNSASSPHE